MAERQQVRDLNLNTPLRPVASPVDTYYRPAAKTVNLETGGGDVEGGGSFKSLAASIGAITPVIQKEISEYEKLRQEEAVKEGALARIKNQKSFKDAQAQGLLRPAENPWFVKGYLQQDGRISGMNYDEALRTSWAQSAAKNSDNPADFQKFIGEFRNKWIEENDGKTPDWMDGFAPKMAQADNNLSAQHVAHRMKVIEDTQEQNMGIEMSKLQQRQTELEAGMDPNDPLVQEGRRATAAQMEAIAADMVRKGLDGKKANQILTEQVIATGVERMEVGYAESILSQIKTPGGTVADITDTREKIQRAESHILNMKRQETQWAWAQEDRPDVLEGRAWAKEVRENTRETWDKQKVSEERTERVRGYTGEMVNEINLAGRLDPNKLALLAKDDPSAAMTMQGYHHTMLTRRAQIISDPNQVAQMNLRIRSNPSSVTEQSIWAGVVAERWSNADAQVMSNELQDRRNSPARTILDKNEAFKTLFGTLGTSVTQNLETARTGAGAAAAGLAQNEFRDLAEDIYSDDKLSKGQKAEALTETYKKLLKKYNEIASEMMLGGSGTTTPTPAKTDKTTPAGPAKTIPQEHVTDLLNNPRDPELLAEFEKTYGPGSAQKVLIGGGQGRYPITK